MALNPFFLQGSYGEQRLVQELINEQLKIYGVEVTYIPRKFVRRQSIIEEIQSSTFDDNFLIEAYINNFDGYSGAGDIMTKFGVSIRDELSLTISKERFEDFIAVFLEDMDDDEIIVSSRPREGDIIYFPLGQRLFEVKFVEHENPFYQLGKNYVYELKCELFEYEDEVIDTTIDEISDTVEQTGYIVDLRMVGAGSTVARVTAGLGTSFVREIFLNNDGSGYTSAPTVTFSSPPTGFTTATAVAITTTRNNITSIKEILLTNPGSGYTTSPTITFSGGGGTGAAATCGIATNSTTKGVVSLSITNGGLGYSVAPTVTIAGPTGSGTTATARAVIGSAGTVTQLYIINPGSGYVDAPAVTVGAAETVGVGTYWRNEVVTGSVSGTTARVKRWTSNTATLQVSNINGSFAPGETITGAKSGASYDIRVSAANTITDKYQQNEEIELEADSILDFSESNPFGSY